MTLTPEQFNKIALKEDLDKLATKEELHQVKDDLLNVMDLMMTKLDRIDSNSTSNQVAHDRFEQRITKLENHSDLRTYIRNA